MLRLVDRSRPQERRRAQRLGYLSQGSQVVTGLLMLAIAGRCCVGFMRAQGVLISVRSAVLFVVRSKASGDDRRPRTHT